MNHFVAACNDFALTIRLSKMQVMGQGVDKPCFINIIDHELAAIHKFICLGCIISDNLSLKAKLNRCIEKATSTFNRLTQQVLKNSKLMEHMKVQVYKACMVSMLLYGSETWTLHSQQEKR